MFCTVTLDDQLYFNYFTNSVKIIPNSILEISCLVISRYIVLGLQILPSFPVTEQINTYCALKYSLTLIPSLVCVCV